MTSGVTHVLRDALSPPERVVWVMWCGAECLVLGDGAPIPSLYFFDEAHAHKATCPSCIVARHAPVCVVAQLIHDLTPWSRHG